MADSYYKDPLSIEDMPDETSASMKKKLKAFKADVTDPEKLKKTGKYVKTMGKGAVSGATFGVYSPGTKKERESGEYELGSEIGSALPIGGAVRAGKYVKKGIELARGSKKLKKTADVSKAVRREWKGKPLKPRKNAMKVDYEKLRETPIVKVPGEKLYDAVQRGLDYATSRLGLGYGDVARAQLSGALGGAQQAAKVVYDQTNRQSKRAGGLVSASDKSRLAFKAKKR